MTTDSEVESEFTDEDDEGDYVGVEEESALFVVPDTGWKYSQQDGNGDDVSIEEQELLSEIQQLQRKLMEVREEKKIGDSELALGLHSAQDEQSADRKGRVLIISNRLPIVLSKDQATGRWKMDLASGGLVTALNGVRQSMDFVWIGWVGQDVPEDARDELRQMMLDEYNCLPVFIPHDVAQLYYNGFCNDVLWPLFHYELLPSFRPGVEKKFDRKQWQAYTTANNLFANTVKSEYIEGDLIWIHDYHLMILPQYLREKGITSPIGWFLHVPFPSSDVYRILPVRNEILKGVLAADMVGFHTYDYARHFLSSCQRVLGLETSIKGVRLNYMHHFSSIGVHPIGIEPAHFDLVMERPSTKARIKELQHQFKGMKILLGVDRIDYIKGMPHKLLAFEVFLRKNPDYQGKVVMLQVGVPSRTQVKEYKKLTGQINEIIGRINGTYGSFGYTPIHYIQRNISSEELCACYVLSDVCLITSLRDGMNLVSHEYILMQNYRTEMFVDDVERQTPGVLLLSEFAGAIQSLSGAVRINPWNTEAVASAIYGALRSDPALNRLRQQKLHQYVSTHTSTHWASQFLADLQTAAVVAEKHRLQHMPNKKDIKKNYKKVMVKKYKTSSHRLIILNYDQILAFDKWDSQFLEPIQFVQLCLKTLSADPKTTVVLYSGRSKQKLDEWFSGQRIVLCAEYGAHIKSKEGNSQWVTMGRSSSSKRMLSWQNAVLSIMKEFDDRTPGSFIERKECSITWFYGDSDKAFGAWQAKDLLSNLEEVLGNYDIKIVQRENALEVRTLASGPREFLREILLTTSTKPSDDDDSIPEPLPFDFVFAAVGASTDDQSIVSLLRMATSAVTSDPELPKGLHEMKAYFDQKSSTFFCQSPKSTLLFSDYKFGDSAEVRRLFRQLIDSKGLPLAPKTVETNS